MPPVPPPFIGVSSTKSFASTTFHHFARRFVSTPLGLFMAWLVLHKSIAYGVLFLGAYFEALVGPSFFIPGEIFFLSGSILAGQGTLNIWLVAFFLYTGAILADSSSYWIGRAIGPTLFTKESGLFKRANYERAEQLLEKYGFITIFIARLIGPFSKIAPVISGMLDIPFTTFLTYNIPGVLIGVGQFIIIGYFFGDRYEFVLQLFERYLSLLLALGALAIVVYILIRRYRVSKKVG